MFKGKGTNNFRKNLLARNTEAKTVRKVVTIIAVALILIFLIGSVSGYMYIKSALKPVDPQSEEEIEVSIPVGSSTSTIAKILEDQDLIKDARIFRFYTKFKNYSNLLYIDYTLTSSYSIYDIFIYFICYIL